jgi:hypothetical protein
MDDTADGSAAMAFPSTNDLLPDRRRARAFLDNDNDGNLDISDSDDDEEFTFSSDYTNDWETIPEDIRRPMEPISFEKFNDPRFVVPHEYINTMEGASKVWKCITADSESLLMNPTDGITWAFCGEVITTLPTSLEKALYFFHCLDNFITDYSKYACPTKNVILGADPKRPTHITNMIWRRMENPSAQANDRGSRQSQTDPIDNDNDMFDMDINSFIQHRNLTDEETIVEFPVSHFKIRVAFTGVGYVVKRRDVTRKHRKVYAILMVTFARNFDALRYIEEQFLRRVGIQESRFGDQRQQEMQHIWTGMIRNVAYVNLGCDEAKLGRPENYKFSPGSSLGVDTLLNLYLIPLQIAGDVNRSVTEENRLFSCKGTMHALHIHGLPRLSFRKNSASMKLYEKYMHKYIDCMQHYRTELKKALDAYNLSLSKKKGKKKDDTEEEEVELALVENLPSVGGWPLAEDVCRTGQRRRITCWGLPPFSLYLQFFPEFTVSPGHTFTTWQANIGGVNNLPKFVQAVVSFYLIKNDEEVGSTQSIQTIHDEAQQYWNIFFKDVRMANPAYTLQKYYSSEANPIDAMLIPGCARDGWLSLCSIFKDVTAQSTDYTIQAQKTQSKSDKLSAYINSCIIGHINNMDCDRYHSIRIMQGRQVLNSLDFLNIVHDGDVSIAKQIAAQRLRMPKAYTHDMYMTVNDCFWRSFKELNIVWTLNNANLEFFYNMLLSQLFYQVGEHNKTWIFFFQPVIVQPGFGHFYMTKDGTKIIDNRKPNSTGMDFVITKTTQLYADLLARVGISQPRDNILTPLNCARWTPASINLVTSVIHSEGKILHIPEREVMHAHIVFPEIRQSALAPLIQNIPRNADDAFKLTLNTVDLGNNNNRAQKTSVAIQPLNVVGLCTNTLMGSHTEHEEWRTLVVVSYVCNPGTCLLSSYFAATKQLTFMLYHRSKGCS